MPNVHKKSKLVPAEYTGPSVGLGDGVVLYNLDGSRRRKKSLEPGDKLLWRDEDVHGKTLWHDPHHQLPSAQVGIGRRIFPEHVGLSDEELRLAGYEWHMPREDLRALEPPPESDHETIPVSIEASQTLNEGDEEQIFETPEPPPEKEEEEKPAEDPTTTETPAQQESEVI
jgi:hypothetical protein